MKSHDSLIATGVKGCLDNLGFNFCLAVLFFFCLNVLLMSFQNPSLNGKNDCSRLLLGHKCSGNSALLLVQDKLSCDCRFLTIVIHSPLIIQNCCVQVEIFCLCLTYFLIKIDASCSFCNLVGSTLGFRCMKVSNLKTFS